MSVYLSTKRWIVLGIIMGVLLAGCQGETTTAPTTVSPAQELPTEAIVTQAPLPSAAVGTTAVPTAAVETATLETTPPAAALPPVEAQGTNEPASGGASANTGKATAFPDPAGYEWREVQSGLAAPIGLTNAGDGSGRLFIVEKEGRIATFQNGSLAPAPFLDIRDRVGSQGSEQGLLGLAFHPRYTENGFFYVNYTDQQGDTQISRFQVNPQDANQADAASEKILLTIPQPFANHNGGEVAFGPDGFLYLGLGDGGSAGDPQGNAQSPDSLLGKILRLDVDQDDPYAIPAGNPFAGGGGKAEVWALGLRNPWRFSFDRQTGDLYIADVGQNQWEEVDFLPANSPGGANFGWDYFEATHLFEGPSPDGTALIDPVYEYDHSQGCSITGGVVYRGASLPEWQGIYLFSDYCSGHIWGLFQASNAVWNAQLLYENLGRIASFGEDEAGEVYVTDLTGRILNLTRK